MTITKKATISLITALWICNGLQAMYAPQIPSNQPTVTSRWYQSLPSFNKHNFQSWKQPRLTSQSTSANNPYQPAASHTQTWKERVSSWIQPESYPNYPSANQRRDAFASTLESERATLAQGMGDLQKKGYYTYLQDPRTNPAGQERAISALEDETLTPTEKRNFVMPRIEQNEPELRGIVQQRLRSHQGVAHQLSLVKQTEQELQEKHAAAKRNTYFFPNQDPGHIEVPAMQKKLHLMQDYRARLENYQKTMQQSDRAAQRIHRTMPEYR